jgi:methylenetetrahydrofolate dehydrogenase (NADP+)/methenyltetrahydrofolate cyclohydrolase
MKFDGRALAREIEEETAMFVAGLMKIPKIVSILVGSDPVSELYTKLKKEAAERVGIDYEIIRVVTAAELAKRLGEVAEQDEVTGIMVQLPVPGISKEESREILQLIPTHKDVDGMRWRESGVVPATVAAVLSVLKKIGNGWEQKRIVVVGARGTVGTPLVAQLLAKGCKVTEVEWDTPNPEESIRQGEIVVSCVGKAGTVTAEMVAERIIAIDVGINKTQGKAVGDMTPEVYQKASISLEVPGGVGPVTVACLMRSGYELVRNVE